MSIFKSGGQQALLEKAMDHYREEKLDAAAQVYDRILDADPDCYEALEWRGEIAIQQDDYQIAADCLGRARKLDPDAFEEFSNLGLAYYELDQPVEAVDSLLKAIELKADDMVAHSNLGKALYELHHAGHPDDAARIGSQWASDFPHVADARHMGAAVAGGSTPARANDTYVAETFDDFSADFETKLAELQYRAPELLGRMLEAFLGTADAGKTILDAGCGTGLGAPFLRPHARSLVGVDLSQGMLEKAKARDIYDQLDCAELTAYLRRPEAVYDLVFAADVLCYFGALEEIFQAAYRTLVSGGAFAFSLERTGGAAEGYRLNPSGRYAHEQAYVTGCLEAAGFTLKQLEVDTLRTEYGEPVTGFVVLAVKG